MVRSGTIATETETSSREVGDFWVRMIDADEIRKKAVPHTRGNYGYSADIRKWAVLVGDIDDAPTIDAVLVVRCKDCKHRGNHEVCPLHDIRLCFDGDGHMDEVEDDKTEDEFFCAYGEREEADKDV